MEIITFNQILILAITNILSGIFIGFGIGIGIFQAIKRLAPKWIHEIIKENRKNSAVSKALEGRKWT